MRITISSLRDIAAGRSGECLSEAYRGAKVKLKWRCGEGHEWEARPDNIRQGQWCPRCGRRQAYGYNITDMRAFAASRGGGCLSTAYLGAHTKLHWVCAEGHEWEAPPSRIIQGGWCFKCRHSRPRVPIEELRELARQRGGECLSDKCTGLRDKLRWRCANGHEWIASASSIRHARSWCPQCNSRSIGEEVCRQMLEAAFGAPFPPASHKWLRGAAGGQLQLDGFMEADMVAFEYQGPHHREAGPWGSTKEGLARQCKNDRLKREQCGRNGVRLIVIEEFDDVFDTDHVLKRVDAALNRAGFIARCRRITLSYHTDELARFRREVEAKAGKVLSTMYLGLDAPHDVLCDKGHKWGLRPYSLRIGRWCPYCAGVGRLTIDDMRRPVSSMR